MGDRSFTYGFRDKVILNNNARFEEITIREGQQRADDLRSRGETVYQELKAIVTMHGETILRRWRKKSSERRQALLISAEPHIPRTRRPHLRAMFELKSFDMHLVQSPDILKALAAPHINIEDLIISTNLSNFIFSRAMMDPAQFFVYDHDTTYFTTNSGIKSLAVIDGYFMLSPGPENHRDWGRLVKEDEAGCMYERYGMIHVDVGEGLCVLELQLETLQFLLRCSKLILHDLNLTQVCHDVLQTPTTFSPVEEVSSPSKSLFELALEAPYRKPGTTDLARFHSLIKSRLESARDHLWALREDPCYFEGTLRRTFEYMYPCRDERCHACPKDWGNAFPQMLGEGYQDVVLWFELEHAAAEVMRLRSYYHNLTDRPTRFPDDLATGFAFLKETLLLVAGAKLQCLMSMLLRPMLISPGKYRKVQVRETPPGADCIGHLEALLVDPDPSDPLSYSIAAKEMFPDHWYLEFQVISDCLERSHNDPTNLFKLGEVDRQHLDDLILVTEILRQVVLLGGWLHVGAPRCELAKKQFEKFTDERVNPFATARSNVIFALPEHEHLLSNSHRRFYYPVDRRRNAVTTKAMQSAELALDAVWSMFDAHCRPLLGQTLNEAYPDVLGEEKSLERTADWQEPELKARIRRTTQDVSSEMNMLYIGTPATSEVRIPRNELPVLKTKVKTKGCTDDKSQDTSSHEPLDDEAVQAEHNKILVDSKAFIVFAILFHGPLKTNKPKELPWSDLLHAFTSIGFSVQKLWGSAWQFTPNKLNFAKHAIQFHEPHPEGKLDYRRARRIGRRLNRAYGWTGDQFVLASDISSEGVVG